MKYKNLKSKNIEKFKYINTNEHKFKRESGGGNRRF